MNGVVRAQNVKISLENPYLHPCTPLNWSQEENPAVIQKWSCRKYLFSLCNQYNKTRHFLYMLRIAGQTAGFSFLSYQRIVIFLFFSSYQKISILLLFSSTQRLSPLCSFPRNFNLMFSDLPAEMYHQRLTSVPLSFVNRYSKTLTLRFKISVELLLWNSTITLFFYQFFLFCENEQKFMHIIFICFPCAGIYFSLINTKSNIF